MTAAIEYSEDLAALICGRLADGESLKAICMTQGCPNKKVVYKWLATRPDFLALYTQAREDQADTLAEEILAISDDSSKDLDENGKVDREVIDRARLRVDSRKWIAARLKPKRWGDRQTIGLGAAEELPPLAAPIDIVDTARRMAFIFAGAELELAKRPAPPLLIEAPRPEAPAAPAPEPEAQFASPFYPSARPVDGAPPYPSYLSTPDDEDGALFSTSKELPLRR